MVLRVVTFKADEKLVEKLLVFCKKRGILVSEAIRTAIWRMIMGEELVEKTTRIGPVLN